MFETTDFTRESGLSKPHAARILKNLLKNITIETITPAKGRRPAIYVFAPLMEVIPKKNRSAQPLGTQF